MKKIIFILAVFIIIAGCNKKNPPPPPIVNTCRDVSVRFGIKVASSNSGYFVEYRLTPPGPDNIKKNLFSPSNNNVVFNSPKTYKVCKSTICAGEQFIGSGSVEILQWYAPRGSSSSLPFDAYIMFNSDTVFKKTSVYDADYKGHMVSIIFDFPCLKKL